MSHPRNAKSAREGAPTTITTTAPRTIATQTAIQEAIEVVVGGLYREHRRLALRERRVLRDVATVALIRLARADNELEAELRKAA